LILVYIVVGIAIGAITGWFFGSSRAKKLAAAGDKAADAQAGEILAAARAEAETLKKDAQVQGKELALKIKTESEDDVRQRKVDLARKEQEVAGREQELAKRAQAAIKNEEDVGKREKTIAQKEQQADAAAKKAEALLGDARGKLEKIASMTSEEAKKALADLMAEDAKKLAATEIKKIESAAREEAAEKAKKIIGVAIQRFAGEYVAERTVSVVPLPSDDMKGRLIGREGRNVRALEAATGADLIIDDTPEAITVSCFNPVRREIARLAIGKLVADGRIHPTRIEEVVAKSEKEVETECLKAGEQACFDLGLHRVHPEIVKLLGGLKFRASYAQSLLQHSVEVGYLAGLMAGELGLNVKNARRAGLLHDLGKAADHEEEGPHATVGAILAKKYGESPKICQAIAAHHEDVPQESVLDHIVDAANRLSGQRPGARREQLESYVKRLTDMEKLARGYPGVEKAFELQAGREVRVIVENSQVSDEQSVLMARELARKIETELTYPGQVRVCVIRETRATDYAK
jgi:ribonuclease Y